MREWKGLIGLRDRLVCEQVRGQNRVRALLVGQGLPAPAGNRARTQAGLAGLGELAKALPECAGGDLCRGELTLPPERHSSLVGQIGTIEAELDALGSADESVALLETVPGVGVRTAEVIAVHLGDAKRFRHANEVSPTRAWSPGSNRAGRRIAGGGSRSAARRCCGARSSSARGACCGTTPWPRPCGGG